MIISIELFSQFAKKYFQMHSLMTRVLCALTDWTNQAFGFTSRVNTDKAHDLAFMQATLFAFEVADSGFFDGVFFRVDHFI